MLLATRTSASPAIRRSDPADHARSDRILFGGPLSDDPQADYPPIASEWEIDTHARARSDGVRDFVRLVFGACLLSACQRFELSESEGKRIIHPLSG
jgi:hypothetical protein